MKCCPLNQDLAPVVMLYGMTKGHSSYAQVTAGWLRGLSELGLLAGYYGLDEDHSDGVASEGATAPVAVYVGPPAGWPLMQERGAHGERCVVLAPNSTWLPDSLIDSLEQCATRVLAPSWWARDVIHRYLRERDGVGISVVNHGVSADTGLSVRPGPVSDGFRAAHFTTTSGQRKGTAELVTAWKRAAIYHLAPRSVLTIVTDDLSVAEPWEQRHDGGSRIEVIPRINAPSLKEFLGNYHVVIQPSRGEGFGMVPLEAAALGVPSVLTDVTGHADYCGPPIHGTTIVHASSNLDDYTSIDDGPGAMAPAIDVKDVLLAIRQSVESYSYNELLAQAHALAVQQYWSWTQVIVRSDFIEVVKNACEGIRHQ